MDVRRRPRCWGTRGILKERGAGSVLLLLLLLFRVAVVFLGKQCW
jgi:hypothetical protein